MASAPTQAQGRRARPRRRPAADVPVVEFRDVTKVYDGGSVGLERASMRIGRGEFVFLVGPTGCGKSTCIRLLMKELEPTEGEIPIAGTTLDDDRRASSVPYLRRNIGVVFQDYKLLPNRTVYDNVAYSLQVIGETRQEIRRKVPDILRLVGLSTKLHNYPDELSGGEQQRVSIARAFVNHPPLLLADEPTGNLDPETSIGIMQLIYRINRTGTTVIVATHDSEMVDKMRRRVIELREGRIVRDELVRPVPPRRVDHRVRDPPARRARRRRRGPPQLMQRSASSSRRRCAACAQRRPEPRRAAHRLITALVLGVFIPIVQATTGTRQRGAQPRRRRRLLKDAATEADRTERAAHARGAPAGRQDASSTSPRTQALARAAAARKRRQEARSSCSAATRCPACSASRPTTRTSSRRSSTPRARAADGQAQATLGRRSTRCATARATRARSSPPPGS